MKRINKSIVVILLLAGFHSVQAQKNKEKRSGMILLPAVFYSPETSFGFGVAGMNYFRTSKDTTARPSNFQTILIYTLENQILITFPYNLFFKQDKLWMKGQLSYYLYPLQYYGIGSDVDLDHYEVYTVDFLRLETNALFRSKPDLYVGPTVLMDKYFKIETESDGGLVTNQIRGIDGGEVFGIGATAIYDKRNNLFAPSGGFYLEGRVLQYEDRLIGDYAFTDLYVDARTYYSPFNKTELALNFYHQAILGKAPFYNLALLGGGKQMRGYYDGAYRDNHQTILQSEVRRYVSKRILLSAFGGLGSISESFGGYEKLLGSYGIGLRYEINAKEKIRIRLDYARGKNTSGFYININEAF